MLHNHFYDFVAPSFEENEFYDIGDNTVVTEHIRRIRAKFLSLGDRPYIETVWGCGYRWKN